MGILSGALSAAGAIWGGAEGAKSFKRRERRIKQAATDNENWYKRRFNEDPTQTASAKRVLTELKEDLAKRTRRAAGAAGMVGGATTEQAAAEKAAATQAMATAARDVAAAGDERKERIEGVYLHNKNVYDEQLNGLEKERGQAIKEAAGQMGAIGKELEGSKLIKGLV